MSERDVLNAIHANLCYPWEWSSSTLDAVAELIVDAGYVIPAADEVDAVVERYGHQPVPVAAFARWRPGTAHGVTLTNATEGTGLA